MALVLCVRFLYSNNNICSLWSLYMQKTVLAVCCVLFLGTAVSAFDYKPFQSWESRQVEKQRVEAALKRAQEAARIQREKRAELNTRRLVAELNKPAPDVNRVRAYIKGGAKPCPALPLAVHADNAPVVGMLAAVKDRCDWDSSVETALAQAMRGDKLRSFLQLTREPVSCPEPFGFNPREKGSRWHPLSRRMLRAVTDRCYRTAEEKQSFFEFSVVKLNPGDRSIFWLGDTYEFALKGRPALERAWLDSIALLVEEKNFKVSDDMLMDIVALGRSPSIYGDSFLPFNTTRKLVLWSLKGGASGPRVLARLDNAEDNWVWKNYSKEERWRISNLLEGKPEMESRSWAAQAARRVKSWF